MARVQPRRKSKAPIDHAEIAYAGICDMLFRDEIVPGQKISYGWIAERLGMSLTPVIQGLKRLEFQGLVRHEPNRGYFTEPISLQEIREIYEAREALELSLVEETVRRLDEVGIARLKGVLDKRLWDPDADDLTGRLMRDREFHLTLAALSGRTLQMQILRNLYDLLYLKYRGSLLFVAAKETVGSEHQQIYDAVITRDVGNAETALRQHFRRIKAKALAALSRMIAEGDLPVP